MKGEYKPKAKLQHKQIKQARFEAPEKQNKSTKDPTVDLSGRGCILLAQTGHFRLGQAVSLEGGSGDAASRRHTKPYILVYGSLLVFALCTT
jgi:hypothetical protein